MRRPLPPRYWRKTVAATQGIVLTIAAADVLPLAVNRGRALSWPWPCLPSRSAATCGGCGATAVADSSGGGGGGSAHLSRPARYADHDPDRPSQRTRTNACERVITAALTILAVVIVWAGSSLRTSPRISR